MSRILNAVKADLLFQFKQGFYFIYIVITLLYVIILHQFDITLVAYILPVLLYIDPSILGLFFIGGILLLEKEQGILALIYVTPLKIQEFMLSKILSLSFLSIIATFSLSLISYSGDTNYWLLFIGVLLTSVIYNLVGFMIATKSKSVNDFFVKIIPLIIIFVIPSIVMFIFPDFWWLNIFPSVTTLKLIWGAYHGISFIEGMFCSIYSLLVAILFFNYTYKTFRDHMVISD